MLAGAHGPGVASAMGLVTKIAAVMGADRLVPITGAHIDSCLYHGQSGLDYVNLFLEHRTPEHWTPERQTRVAVPTTLNVSSLDLLHPELFKGSSALETEARSLVDAYLELGCEPTWTCAPYQLEQRPSLGEHVAWAESNAVVFANSVLGARTHRYGDFIDIAAAISGRVPNAGLHKASNRRATIIVDVSGLSPGLLASNAAYPVIGFILGRLSGSEVPAIVGLGPDTSEDNLKALGAAAASSGRLAMFHAVGLTPEASTLEAATGGNASCQVIRLSGQQVRDARDSLTSATHNLDGTKIATVSLGTPHYSVSEIAALVEALDGQRIHPSVEFFVSTGRDVLTEVKLRGWDGALEAAGVTFVTDTCTYITPILSDVSGVAMTDSAKWAYYAPGNLGVEVVFGSLTECVESAVAGFLVRDEQLWADAS